MTLGLTLCEILPGTVLFVRGLIGNDEWKPYTVEKIKATGKKKRRCCARLTTILSCHGVANGGQAQLLICLVTTGVTPSYCQRTCTSVRVFGESTRRLGRRNNQKIAHSRSHRPL